MEVGVRRDDFDNIEESTVIDLYLTVFRIVCCVPVCRSRSLYVMIEGFGVDPDVTEEGDTVSFECGYYGREIVVVV